MSVYADQIESFAVELICSNGNSQHRNERFREEKNDQDCGPDIHR